MKFRFHIPAFMDVEPLPDAPYETIEELLKHQRVASWSTDPGFYRYSLCDGHRLMAELDGGKKWWVIGYLSDPPPPDALPVWKPIK